MSGIFGKVRFTEDPGARILSRMAGALAHRGPDGTHIWQKGPVGLGHCMLHTTPESLHEHLPLTSDDGMITITADARVDNRDELLAGLYPGLNKEIIPDSSLILAAYQRWGESCVEHLLGDFAFAIWDAQKQHLFCARDHMGVKPFYYYSTDECFAFGSEMKALFAVPGIPREINEKVLAFRLAGYDAYPGSTSYMYINRLPPAHDMTFSRSGIRLHLYWSLDPCREIRFRTDGEYENAFRSLFTDAVRCRMRSAFPVGSELSGGLDSSSVVSVARHHLRRNKGNPPPGHLHVFSSVFDEVPECDERPFINYVLSGGDLISHMVYPERLSPLDDIRHRVSQCEDPSISPTSHTYSAIYQAAHDAGVRVVMSGDWGDAVVSYGRGSIREFVVAGKWLRAIREIVSLSENFGEKKLHLFWSFVVVPLVPWQFRKWYTRSSRTIPWIRDDFAKRTGLAEYYSHIQETELKAKTSREHHFLVLTSVPISVGMEMMNKVAAAYSVEPRYPFLDRRVIEFCLALPPEQRIRQGFTRAIEREGLAEYLPPAIRRRVSKAMADPYITYGLVKFERQNLKDILCHHPNVIRLYLNLDQIRDKWRTLLAGGTVPIAPLWRSVILDFWLREENLIKSHPNDSQ